MPCYYCPHGLLILKEMNPEYSLEGISFLSPGVCSNSCLLSWWCYLTTSSYATLFSFCLQSFPASASFPMSWLLAPGSQSIRASASASALPVNIQGWIKWSNLPAVQGTLKSSPAQFKSINSLALHSSWSNSHIHT